MPEFQFTHPGKGATPGAVCYLTAIPSFNSRTLGRVRQVCDLLLLTSSPVSIHAPWEGCDGNAKTKFRWFHQFQFTHPGKGATETSSRGADRRHGFNSRTLGRVRLLLSRIYLPARLRFNSRTLGRVRPTIGQLNSTTIWFQFTHPGKGATER